MMQFLQEFRQSAIPDRLTLVNVGWIDEDEAVEVLTEHTIAECQRVTSYVTESAKRLLKRYESARAGGWLAYGTTLDGGLGPVAYFKALVPRKVTEFKGFGQPAKVKEVSYETPAKADALPILPFVDEETAQKIYQRYSVEPLEGETFWQVVKRCNLPVAVPEGLKKALSLLAQGIPAIAIRGITQWHRKGTNELHEAIAHFATPGRTIYIVFDQDEKLSTQRDVRTQILKLGAALEAQGCKVMVPIWDRSLGKGIDDALYGQGENAQQWLNELLRNARSLGQYRQADRLNRALEVIERLNRLSYQVERATEGEYLPELPALQQGAIHILSASMNSGKTYRIGRDWVKWAIAAGWNVLVLNPLNSLGEQTAADWKLPHIHTYGTSAEQQQALWADASHSHGIVMCPDSLHRIPEWFWSRPVLLVLDEANQVVEHIAQGDTLKSRWADILERFTSAARHAISTGAIVLSEDGIPNRCVNFVKTISDAETVRVFSHYKQGIPWNCTAYRGQASGFRALLLDAVKRGKRLLFVTSSQAEGKRVEQAIAEVTPGCKVVRIDSEANQGGQFSSFFESPDTWLNEHTPDVLILSPSAKSGVSIQGGVAVEDAYFGEVWGYFSTLGTDTHTQLLGRYRPSVPRIVFCPDFTPTSGEESLLYPRAIKRRLHSNGAAIAGVYGIDELLTAEDERAALLATIETAVLSYLAEAKAVTGAQKQMLNASLVSRLEQAGHCVSCSIRLLKDARTVDLWKEVQEAIWRDDAAAIASAEVTPEHSPEWARRTLDSLECSLETGTLAQKVLYRDEFPGVDFDDAQECYEALCRDYGAMRRGVLLQAKAENLDAAKESDRAAAEAILKGDLRALHRLPKGYARAMLVAKTGVLELLDGNPYSNTDPRAIAVKSAALKWAGEIGYWLRLQVKPSQTPVEIAHKLLKKLNLEADRESRPGEIQQVARPGKRGEHRDKVYQVDLTVNPVRGRLLEALRHKLSGSVSSIRNNSDSLNQIKDTPPELAPWFTPESLADIREQWAAADTSEMRQQLRQWIPAEALERAIA